MFPNDPEKVNRWMTRLENDGSPACAGRILTEAGMHMIEDDTKAKNWPRVRVALDHVAEGVGMAKDLDLNTDRTRHPHRLAAILESDAPADVKASALEVLKELGKGAVGALDAIKDLVRHSANDPDPKVLNAGIQTYVAMDPKHTREVLKKEGPYDLFQIDKLALAPERAKALEDGCAKAAIPEKLTALMVLKAIDNYTLPFAFSLIFANHAVEHLLRAGFSSAFGLIAGSAVGCASFLLLRSSWGRKK